MTRNQLFGYSFGAVYLLVGLVGFAVTGGVSFAATSGKSLIIFELNLYLLIGLVGFALVGANANIIALNHPDNLLHLATAVVALAVGLKREPAVSVR